MLSLAEKKVQFKGIAQPDFLTDTDKEIKLLYYKAVQVCCQISSW